MDDPAEEEPSAGLWRVSDLSAHRQHTSNPLLPSAFGNIPHNKKALLCRAHNLPSTRSRLTMGYRLEICKLLALTPRANLTKLELYEGPEAPERHRRRPYCAHGEGAGRVV